MPTFGQDLAAAIWGGWETVDALTTVTITTTTGHTIDHTTGAITPLVVTETVGGLVTPFRPDEVDGLRVTTRDRKVLIQRSEVTTPPTLTSTVTMDGQAWSMQSPPEPVANDGLWQLHVRRVGDV